jgi:hypothetical protein
MALTPEQTAAVANAGAGSLSDLVKQAKADFALDAEASKNFGAGFVSDLLRMAAPPPEPLPPYVAEVMSITPDNPAIVKVSAADFPFFTVGAMASFSDTGSIGLDGQTVAILSTNATGKTFKVDCDRTAEQTVTTGTVSTPQIPVAVAAKPATILDNPPPVPKLEPQPVEGYPEDYR